MKFDFNKETTREGTHSVQYEGTEALFGVGGLEPFWIADMDIETPEAIREAIKERIDNGIFGYTIWQNEQFYEPIKHWWQSRYNTVLSDTDIHYSPTVLFTAGEALRQVTKERDGIILTTPSYNKFPSLIESNNRKIVESPLIYDKDLKEYFLDVNHFTSLCERDDVSMYIHCNPHNPTGKVWTREELQTIKDICAANNIYLISDEIHMDFVRPKEDFVSLAALSEEGDQVLVASCLGKTFNLASIPHSYFVTKDRTLTKTLTEVTKEVYNVGNASSLALAAIEAAYTECNEWVDQLNNHILNNFEYVQKYIDDNLSQYLSLDIPRATYLGWISFEKSGFDAELVHKALVEVGGIAVSPGKLYLDYENKHFRFNVASSRARIEDGLIRIKKTFDYLYNERDKGIA